MTLQEIRLSSLSERERLKAARIVLLELQDVRSYYPNFLQWYYLKVLPQIATGKRDVVLYTHYSDVCGIEILKNGEEKKICTLKVNAEYQKRGIGKKLFETSFKILQTDNPIITVSDSKVFQFRRVLNDYKFQLTQVCRDKYIKGKSELVFNGMLSNVDYSRRII